MGENETLTVTSMRQQVAEEVRVMLARRRMSASQVARQIGVTQPYISRRLTGDIAFDVDDLARIARALDVPIVTLFGDAATGTKADTIGYPGDDEITHSERHGEPHLLTKSHLMRPRRPVRLTPRVA